MNNSKSNKRDASEMTIDGAPKQGNAGGDKQGSNRSGPVCLSRRSRGSIHTLLSRPSPFGNESGSLPIGEFDAASAADKAVMEEKVLVIGAGGLGCEILKDLALVGILPDVTVIDLDTIDVTNLNRQFLFRKEDVGKSKAEVAANFINRRCPWMNVKYYHGKIQDKDLDFYRQFNVVISGLDNVEARRWLNATICGLVEFDSDGDPLPETIIPIIDGGTEGFSGQARVILPRITSCFECSLDAFAPTQAFPLCTVADTPRIPQHCIAYAYLLQWPREFPNKKLDKDSPEDMKWIYEKAAQRAEDYGIQGVTYMMTMGVVKNIIPAVASTNAIVSAVCVNEAVKILSFCSQSLNTYMMYMGSEGVYSHTFIYERKETCPVCTTHIHKLTLPPSTTLNKFLQLLKDDDNFRLKSPSVTSSSKTLYMRNPPALERATKGNLDKTLDCLIDNGEELTVTDPVFPHTSLMVVVSFSA